MIDMSDVIGLIILLEVAAIFYVYLLKKDVILLPILRYIFFFIGAAICVLRDLGLVISFPRMLIMSISNNVYLADLILLIEYIPIWSSLIYVLLRAGFNEWNNTNKQINTKIVTVSNVVYLISIVLSFIILKHFSVISIIVAGLIVFLMFKITAELNKLCLKERIICPCCGMYVPSGANVCKKCGNALDTHNLSDSTEDMVICPYCSAENLRGKKFCIRCGNILPHEEEKQKAKCPNCGADLDEDAVFCGECGFDLAPRKPDILVCPSCSAENAKGKKFCSKCGNRLI